MLVGWPPQIVAFNGTAATVGTALTVTVVVNGPAVVHPLALTLKLYVTITAALVVFVRVSVITDPGVYVLGAMIVPVAAP
jgi:hypothetical protein